MSEFYAKPFVAREGAPMGNKNAAGSHHGGGKRMSISSVLVGKTPKGKLKIGFTRDKVTGSMTRQYRSKSYAAKPSSAKRFERVMGNLAKQGRVGQPQHFPSGKGSTFYDISKRGSK
jgi:hypothetical protein